MLLVTEIAVLALHQSASGLFARYFWSVKLTVILRCLETPSALPFLTVISQPHILNIMPPPCQCLVYATPSVMILRWRIVYENTRAIINHFSTYKLYVFMFQTCTLLNLNSPHSNHLINSCRLASDHLFQLLQLRSFFRGQIHSLTKTDSLLELYLTCTISMVIQQPGHVLWMIRVLPYLLLTSKWLLW